MVPEVVPIWKLAPPVLTLGFGAVHWCPVLPEPKDADIKSKLSKKNNELKISQTWQGIIEKLQLTRQRVLYILRQPLLSISIYVPRDFATFDNDECKSPVEVCLCGCISC